LDTLQNIHQKLVDYKLQHAVIIIILHKAHCTALRDCHAAEFATVRHN